MATLKLLTSACVRRTWGQARRPGHSVEHQITLLQRWVISCNFLFQSLTRDISYSMENLAFDSLLRWKLIELSILTTSLIHLFLNGQENLYSELGSERVKALGKQTFKSTQVCKTRTCVQTCHGWPNRFTSPLESSHKSQKVVILRMYRWLVINLCWLALGDQTVRNLCWLTYKFELDESQCKSSQVYPSGWPNKTQVEHKSKTCIDLCWLPSPFGQGFNKSYTLPAMIMKNHFP